MPRRAKKADRIPTVTFRPDSRDGSKDFQIPASLAKQMFNEGKIAGDATNGGYMPLPGQREFGVNGWRSLIAVHKVPDEQAHCCTIR